MNDRMIADARDDPLDAGMRFLHIWRRRRAAREQGRMDLIERWVHQRMKRRAVVAGRSSFLQVLNDQIARIRQVGNLALAAGIQPWTDDEVREALEKWEVAPPCPIDVPGSPHSTVRPVAQACRSTLRAAPQARRASIERSVLVWLCAFMRRNVRRGRQWELSEVLARREADCLGYSRLLWFLTADFGLDAGVVEVVRDVRGRFVPHYACLVTLSSGRRQIVDPWYASTDIHHRLLLAGVPGGAGPALREVLFRELSTGARLLGLSHEQLSATSLYIMGNAHLAHEKPAEAVECYDASLWLYPGNSRALFNKAIALEQMGRAAASRDSYEQAFSAYTSLARLLATVEELESLIELDQRGVLELDQRIYLSRLGFATGRRQGWPAIARRYGMTPAEAEARFKEVVRCLKTPTAGSRPSS